MAAAGLSVAATYYEVPDHVEVLAALVDDDSEPLDPIEVRSLSVYLMKGETVLQSACNLDRFYADQNLFTTVFFSRPAHIRGLQVKAVAIERDTAETFTRYVTVRTSEVDPAEDEFGDNAPNVME